MSMSFLAIRLQQLMNWVHITKDHWQSGRCL